MLQKKSKCVIIIMYDYLESGGDDMDIRVGDILLMKKQHPGCGSSEMLVQRCGADFRLCCKGCGHVFMMPRGKCEKKIKAIIRSDNNSGH